MVEIGFVLGAILIILIPLMFLTGGIILLRAFILKIRNSKEHPKDTAAFKRRCKWGLGFIIAGFALIPVMFVGLSPYASQAI